MPTLDELNAAAPVFVPHLYASEMFNPTPFIHFIQQP